MSQVGEYRLLVRSFCSARHRLLKAPDSIVLITQDVIQLSPLSTATRLIPMGKSFSASIDYVHGLKPPAGVVGFFVSVAVAPLVELASTRTLVCGSLVLAIGSVVPAALLDPRAAGFWGFVFPTTILSVAAVSVVYNVLAITLCALIRHGRRVEVVLTQGDSVGCSERRQVPGWRTHQHRLPARRRVRRRARLVRAWLTSSCSVGLAVCGTVSSTVRIKHGDVDGTEALMAGFAAALWSAGGMAGAALVASILGIRRGVRATGEAGTVH
jgi:hypothetical protein